MYQLGELVVYGVHGVCRVSQVQERRVDRATQQYLVLEPVSRGGSQYLVPMHNPAAMKKLSPLMTPQELEGLLASDTVKADCWIPEENRRKQSYRELSGSASREKLMQTVHTLYKRKRSLQTQGKKLHICDDNFLHDAEKVLSGEIEAVLGIDNQEALQYLRSRLQEQ